MDKPEQIKGLLRLPAMLSPVDTDKKETVGNIRTRVTRGFGKSGNMTFHPATSWLGRA